MTDAWPGFVIALIGLMLLLFVWIGDARAHSWYSSYCCNKNDCSEVIKMGRTADGKYLVQTKHGTMLFPADQKILPAPDGKWHGCMFRRQIIAPGIHKGRCLYGGGFV